MPPRVPRGGAGKRGALEVADVAGSSCGGGTRAKGRSIARSRLVDEEDVDVGALNEAGDTLATDTDAVMVEMGFPLVIENEETEGEAVDDSEESVEVVGNDPIMELIEGQVDTGLEVGVADGALLLVHLKGRLRQGILGRKLLLVLLWS